MANSNFVGDFESDMVIDKKRRFPFEMDIIRLMTAILTKSTLTTQGVGLMYKKDFNTWDELFRWFLWKRRKGSLQKTKRMTNQPIKFISYLCEVNLKI